MDRNVRDDKARLGDAGHILDVRPSDHSLITLPWIAGVGVGGVSRVTAPILAALFLTVCVSGSASASASALTLPDDIGLALFLGKSLISLSIDMPFMYVSSTFHISFVYVSCMLHVSFNYVSSTFHISFMYVSLKFRSSFVDVSWTLRPGFATFGARPDRLAIVRYVHRWHGIGLWLVGIERNQRAVATLLPKIPIDLVLGLLPHHAAAEHEAVRFHGLAMDCLGLGMARPARVRPTPRCRPAFRSADRPGSGPAPAPRDN